MSTSGLVPEELHDRLDYVLCKVAEAVKRAADESFAEVGLRSNHHTVLRVLAACGPMSQQDVAQRLQVDPSTVVDLVDQLESRGLLTRSRNPADRRAYVLELTRGGDALLSAGDERSLRLQADLFAALPPADRAEFQRLLHRLAAKA